MTTPKTSHPIKWLNMEDYPFSDPTTPVDEWRCASCDAYVGWVLHDTEDNVAAVWNDCAASGPDGKSLVCEGCVDEDEETWSPYSCDACGKIVPNGSGVYVRGRGADEERVCMECAVDRGMLA